MNSRLVNVRNALKMNQEQFASFLGIPKTTYHNYESGRSDLKSDFLINVSKKCNVSVDYILGVQDEIMVSARNDLTQEELNLIDKFRQLNKDGRMEASKHTDLLIASGMYSKSAEREKMA